MINDNVNHDNDEDGIAARILQLQLAVATLQSMVENQDADAVAAPLPTASPVAAPSPSPQAAVEEESCPVCFEVPSQDNGASWILVCENGHSVCTNCVDALCRMGHNDKRCPLCREHFDETNTCARLTNREFGGGKKRKTKNRKRSGKKKTKNRKRSRKKKTKNRKRTKGKK